MTDPEEQADRYDAFMCDIVQTCMRYDVTLDEGDDESPATFVSEQFGGGVRFDDVKEMVDAAARTRFLCETRVAKLEVALEKLIHKAEMCDGWESFPADDLDAAKAVLNYSKKTSK